MPESLQGLRHLGHVELVQAGNGTVMILRHTSPLNTADKEKLECFSHSQGLSLFLAPQSEILERVSGESPRYDSNGLRLTFSPRDFIGECWGKSTDGCPSAGMAGCTT